MSSFETHPVIFVIDTNSYSGNFEREMTAYITGQVGECEVGEELADVFREEMGSNTILDDMCCDVPNEDDHRAPCGIWPTPNRYNDGYGRHFDGDPQLPQQGRHEAYESVAIFLNKVPTEEQISIMKERAMAFCAHAWQQHGRMSEFYQAEIIVLGFRLITREVTIIETDVSV